MPSSNCLAEDLCVAVQGDQALQWELSQRTERSKEKKNPLVISTFIVIS